ncbi:FAD binding domain protein [Aspergillus heteromorphus CBS 117.55]|uniref:FAD binding domain protein n=1 Tax=Aspergillus heteromorphus CBS 117.55 TaxID=1448321 RepID=A0A317WTF8_9EURO|nr:FAD binding domain protein [Aspergillus heteromorphus CBS 117.55]PWY88218.1 FAD binding domain protein [Aspergillus heteromorphus CBS 117.55]
MASPPPILILGASIVGLTASLALTTAGIPNITLEKHTHISAHPRAMGFTPRTMEYYRSLGIAEQIPQAPADFTLLRARVHSLAGEWFERTAWSKVESEPNPNPKPNPKPKVQPTPKRKPKFSSLRGAAIPQDKLERILETTALARGADIRRGWTVTGFVQDERGITVTALTPEGEKTTIRGVYLIAADGSKSTIRTQLDILRTGRGHMQTMRSVLFRADLSEYATEVLQFNIEQPGLRAFLTTYNDGRWVLMFYDDIERNGRTLLSCICAAIGRDDIPVEIITTGRWELTAWVAERFRVGRVFLVGDAAHTLPPNRGGYGANTGIGDVENLVWKMKMVLGVGGGCPAGEELLDTYEVERRSVALLRHEQIFARADYKVHLEEGREGGEVVRLDDDAVEFGQIYRSKGFLGEEGEYKVPLALPPALRPDEWKGQPGTRVPHFMVKMEDGREVSIAEVVDGMGWTVLSAGEKWRGVVEDVNDGLQVVGGVRHVRVGDAEEFCRAFGMEEGAVLVRPDGYIAWRTEGVADGLVAELGRALETVAFRNSSKWGLLL